MTVGTSSTANLQVNQQDIPLELRSEQRWVLWRLISRKDKLTKPPFTPEGTSASVDDPATWCSFDEAIATFTRGGFSGIGFVLGSGWAGIDLDECLTSEIPAEISEILDIVEGYAEISPMGKGIHIITRGKLPAGPRQFNNISLAKKVECYDSGRFFTITGKMLRKGNLRDEKSAALVEIYYRFDLENFKATTEAKAQKLAEGSTGGYGSHSEADLAFCHFLLRYTNRDVIRADRLFRLSKLYRPKWDERHSADGKTYGQMTLEKAIQGMSQRAPLPTNTNANLTERSAAIASTISKPLAFPQESYIGLAAEFADLYSLATEGAKEFYYIAFLTHFGALIADLITVDTEDQPEPRLYSVLLAGSGDRKSATCSFTSKFFKRVFPEFSLLTGTGSAEGLAEDLRENPKTLLYFDEFKVFVDKSNREGSVLLPLVGQLWDRNDYQSRTKTRKISLSDTRLSLLAACTCETYSRMFKPTYSDIGFLNRLFVVLGKAERRFSFARSIPDDLKAAVGDELAQVFSHIRDRANAMPEGKIILRWSPDAKTVWDDWYLGLNEPEFGKRLDSYGLRFIILLSALKREFVKITAETVTQVVAILNYELAARREVHPVEAETLQAALQERIRRALANGPMRMRDLKRKLSYNRYGTKLWEEAITGLQKSHEILVDQETHQVSLINEEDSL